MRTEQHSYRNNCKTKATITKDSNLLRKNQTQENNMHNARPNPEGNQMHRGFRGVWENIRPLDKRRSKDPKENFTRSVTPSNVATLH